MSKVGTTATKTLQLRVVDGRVTISNNDGRITLARKTVCALACIRSGQKTFGDGESWIDWAMYQRSWIEQVGVDLTDVETVTEVFPFHAPTNNGPGEFFAKKIIVRKSRSRILITQRMGYDDELPLSAGM